jgi:DNA-binding transcriptional MerR regulator
MTAMVEEKLLTIGAVCGRLKDEFPDISISKIRYLEDQGLLTPKRTSGGYRLFSEDDVERLTTILRLQRDEFLPLRVIRQELASPASKDRRRKRRAGLAEPEPPLLEASELAERAGIRPEQVRELEEFGLLMPVTDGGQKRYPEGDADVAHLCARLAEFGVGPRHLRTLRTSADRTAALIEAVTAPALRARSPERRRAGIEDLRALGELTQELSTLLLWRQLRRQVGE